MPSPQEIKKFVDNPPADSADVAFMYRQAAGSRIQLQRRAEELQRELQGVQTAVVKAVGYEEALHDVIVRRMDAAPKADPPKDAAPAAAGGVA